MARRKNTTPAQIINHLRKAEGELANGKTVREVCKGLRSHSMAPPILGQFSSLGSNSRGRHS